MNVEYSISQLKALMQEYPADPPYTALFYDPIDAALLRPDTEKLDSRHERIAAELGRRKVRAARELFLSHEIRLLNAARGILIESAFTVELEPPGKVVRSGKEALEDAFAEFEEIRRADGCVVVICNRSPRSSYSHFAAVWGGIMSNTTHRLGASGVITNGFVRDHYQIEAIGREAQYLVFGKGNCSLDARGHLQLKGYMHSIRLPGLDVEDGMAHDVRIDHGDLVVADNDGVLVIPRSIAQDVIDLAVERYRAERSVISGIREQPGEKVIPFLRDNGIL